MYNGEKPTRKTNPKEKSNLLSIITFFFTFELLKKGFKKDITESDIYEISAKFKSSTLGNDLEKQWLKEKRKKGRYSIYRLLWKCYGKGYLLLGFMNLVVKVVKLFVYPEAFGKLISYFTPKSKLTNHDAAYYAVIVIAMNILHCTYGHNYMLLITELGIEIKTAFCSLLYRKSLKLSPSALSENGIGKIATLISKDVTTFEIVIIFLNDIWISVILVTTATCLMYSKIGVAAIVGMLFLLLMVPVQIYLGKLTSQLRKEAGNRTDHRLQKTQETLSAIKTVKMYSWEYFFGDIMCKARDEEMGKIKRFYFIRAAFLQIGELIISLTMYVTVMTYTQLGNTFTAEQMSFLWGCLATLRSPVTISLPLGIAAISELTAAVYRIHNVLTAAEDNTLRFESEKKPFIRMDDVSVTAVLREINLKIESGLNIITGKTGSGKTSLVKTILRNYPICGGNLQIHGTTSYAPQEPWLFPSSIKQNILFGQKFDETRYRKVLSVCALDTDFGTFIRGDETIISDRGMHLSKGQQARIGLARAVYCDSDIYLLDDCLSSLDNHVQKMIYSKCVKGFLKSKIVVMVTHNKHFFKEAEQIIIIGGGTIKSKITMEEIKKQVFDNDEFIHNQIDINADKTQNTYYEEKREGKVDPAVYKKYCQFGGGYNFLISIFALFVAAQTGLSFTDKLLSSWVNIQQNITDDKFQFNHSSEYEELRKKNQNLLGYYTLAIVVTICMFVCRTYVHFSFVTRASVALHKYMTLSVVNATMTFFDQWHLGNILNRFVKDLATIDELIPFNIYECLIFICKLTGTLILIVQVNWSFLIPAVIGLVLLFLIRQFYIPTGRSLKRLESATRSPVIGHVNASLEGLTTVRAHGTQEILKREFDNHQDLYTSAFYMMQCTTRAFVYFLDMLCNFFTIDIIIWFLVAGKDTSAGNVGLAIQMSTALIGVLQWGIRQWAEVENNMTSVERVLEYTNAEKENTTGVELEDWPKTGKIGYENVSLTYGKTKGYVLKNINFAINSCEKIGIVGRTGVGKSSLISLLFRLYEYNGIITIDDVDIKTISLDFLRSSIAIIPQDPVLFAGTIRSNIDPTGRYKDEEIWEAIDTVKMKKLIDGLDYQIAEGGSNFSSGQKQLICLARAIIRKNKIIILDEATANVDLETDTMVQTVIRDNLADCTVVFIAHRLQTVLLGDRVMVIDEGEIEEFDDPKELLSNKNGAFFKINQMDDSKNGIQ